METKNTINFNEIIKSAQVQLREAEKNYNFIIQTYGSRNKNIEEDLTEIIALVNKCGLFDSSHGLEYLNKLLTSIKNFK